MIKVFEELADPSRRRLLAELRSGPKSVSDLVVATFMKQPNVSNHLARMRCKGVVVASKVGRQVYYSLADAQIEALVESACQEARTPCCELNVAEAAKKFAQAATHGDEGVCDAILDHALRRQMSLLEIYQDLLAPAMKFVASWYSVEAIDTAQQNMATAITERIMGRVVQSAGPAKVLDKTVLLGCGPNSWHVIGLRMVADYLRLSGWKVFFIGANVPQACYLNSVEKNQPDLVLLSCLAQEGLPCGLNLIRALRAKRMSGKYFSIGVGGCCPGAQEQFLEAGADFTCPDLKTFAREYLPELERKK